MVEKVEKHEMRAGREAAGPLCAECPDYPEAADVCCEACELHPERIAPAVLAVSDAQESSDLAELFKCLGDPTRVNVIRALLTGELCVCDLAEVLGLSQSALSHQLRILRGVGLVAFRREGKNVYYRVRDAGLAKLLETARGHIRGA